MSSEESGIESAIIFTSLASCLNSVPSTKDYLEGGRWRKTEYIRAVLMTKWFVFAELCWEPCIQMPSREKVKNTCLLYFLYISYKITQSHFISESWKARASLTFYTIGNSLSAVVKSDWLISIIISTVGDTGLLWLDSSLPHTRHLMNAYSSREVGGIIGR